MRRLAKEVSMAVIGLSSVSGVTTVPPSVPHVVLTLSLHPDQEAMMWLSPIQDFQTQSWEGLFQSIPDGPSFIRRGILSLDHRDHFRILSRQPAYEVHRALGE
jgi:hypothetical protein